MSEQFVQAVSGGVVKVERIANGTNVIRLIAAESRADALRERLRSQSVVLPAPVKEPAGAVFLLHVNETWNRTTGARLAEQVRRAIVS